MSIAVPYCVLHPNKNRYSPQSPVPSSQSPVDISENECRDVALLRLYKDSG
ncbi:hypothetical protein [Nostoc sp.]|uniref:hypothetical protein n=1 Tax=Nostoc sp. TaxID=1180 RepID=UPI002FEED872